MKPRINGRFDTICFRQGTADARLNNIELDADLRSNGIVNHDLYERFCDAWRYDAATSIGWLRARLSILLERTRQGEIVSLFSPNSPDLKTVGDEQDFRDWVDNHFPDLGL
ncbi:hypothetical protein [Rhizobium binxianense]